MPRGTAIWNANGGFVSVLLAHLFVFYLPFARWAKGEVLVLLYVFCLFVCLFVWSTISRQSAGRFKPSFACGRILVPNVSSPLLGVSGPRQTEKGGNEIFVTMGVNGEFLHFGDFWAISSNTTKIITKTWRFDLYQRPSSAEAGTQFFRYLTRRKRV